jgi:hypothetical protein
MPDGIPRGGEGRLFKPTRRVEDPTYLPRPSNP